MYPVSTISKAKLVSAASLTPIQRPTPKALEVASDFRQQYMLKHAPLSCFHSLAEYLYAGLLEGNPSVNAYVPQPFLLRIFGEHYTPDCYFNRNGEHFVVELKPKGEFPDAKRIPLEQFFAIHGMTFEVLSNESVLEQLIKALNWIEIVRNLYSARMIDTNQEEVKVLQQLEARGRCTLGEFVDPGDRERTYLDEIALMRLLHRGLVVADLDDQVLDYSTRFYSCTYDGESAYNKNLH